MAKYQYETSPRKIKPEYEKQKKYKEKQIETKKKQAKKKKNNTFKKIKTVFYVVLGFAMFFSISYRNAIIDIKYSKIKELKTELAAIQKENEQLEANVEQALNLKTIQEEAMKNLGMKTLSTDQIEYISLSKKDHIEPNTETVEEKNYFQKIIECIKKIIK